MSKAKRRKRFKPAPIPTQDEIRERAAAIRKTWTPEQRRRRKLRGGRVSWELLEVAEPWLWLE